MEVYDFEKSLLTRLQETSDVLCARGIALPASGVRTEWANYVEMAIEPTGWQAQWRVPRVICEELSIKYPTVVVGTVEQVLFDELKAIFTVESVQDDDVQMPDKQMVSLEELWPLKEQENDALNVDRTADCLDRLRFFYQHVWMPWDNDEDDNGIDWAEQNLYDRVKFYYDVKKRAMSKRLVSHVLALLAEANYVQKKREMLEMEIEEEEGNENGSDGESLIENRRTTKLVELHLRLNVIKNEIKILEDPTLREAFEKVRFGSNLEEQSVDEVLIVVQTGALDQQIEYLKAAKATIGQEKVRLCDSLQNALDRCIPLNDVYLPPGRHVIKFLEYLNGGGSLKAVHSTSFVDAYRNGLLGSISDKTVVSSKDDDSVLLTVDGDYHFEHIVIDCANVRTGVLIKQGNVTFKNCYLIGDSKSSTKQGVVAFGNSTIHFENCVLKDFSTGIYANENCEIHFFGSIVLDCISGMDILCGGQASFKSSEVRNCKTYGVLLEVQDLNTSQESDRVCYNNYKDIDRCELKFEGNCDFQDNGKSNFIVSKTGKCKFNNSCFVEQSTPSSNVSSRSVRSADIVQHIDAIHEYKTQLDDVKKILWGHDQTNNNVESLETSEFDGSYESSRDESDLYETGHDKTGFEGSMNDTTSLVQNSVVIEIDESIIEID